MGVARRPPDEFYVIESSNPKIQGIDGAVLSFAEYLVELGKD
jgi:RNase P/RNase MRP subunit p29